MSRIRERRRHRRRRTEMNQTNIKRFVAPLPVTLPDIPETVSSLTLQVRECFKEAYANDKFRRWLEGTNNAEATGGVLKFDHARAVEFIIDLGRTRQMS